MSTALLRGARMPCGGAIAVDGGVFEFVAVRDVRAGDDVLVETETGDMASPVPGKKPHGWKRLYGRSGTKARWLDDVRAGERGRVWMPPAVRRYRTT